MNDLMIGLGIAIYFMIGFLLGVLECINDCEEIKVKDIYKFIICGVITPLVMIIMVIIYITQFNDVVIWKKKEK
jgi:hypothetical protein